MNTIDSLESEASGIISSTKKTPTIKIPKGFVGLRSTGITRYANSCASPFTKGIALRVKSEEHNVFYGKLSYGTMITNLKQR